MQDLVGRTDQAIDVGRWVKPILGNGRGQIEAGNQGLTERLEVRIATERLILHRPRCRVRFAAMVKSGSLLEICITCPRFSVASCSSGSANHACLPSVLARRHSPRMSYIRRLIVGCDVGSAADGFAVLRWLHIWNVTAAWMIAAKQVEHHPIYLSLRRFPAMGLCAFLGVDHWPQVGNRHALGSGCDISGFQHCYSALNTVRPVPPALGVESHQNWSDVSFDRPTLIPTMDIESFLLGACILRQNHPAKHSRWDPPDAVTAEQVVSKFHILGHAFLPRPHTA